MKRLLNTLTLLVILSPLLPAQQQETPEPGESAVAAKPVPETAPAQPPAPPATAQPAATATAAAAAADAKVDGMLFYASDEATAPEQEEKVQIKPAVLTDISARLGKVYKQKHFHLIGKHTQKVFKEYESWVVPSKDLCLKMDSRGPAEGGGVNLHLQLWQDKKVLVKSDTVIQAGRPVFLGGPAWRGGRLIFVVMLSE